MATKTIVDILGARGTPQQVLSGRVVFSSEQTVADVIGIHLGIRISFGASGTRLCEFGVHGVNVYADTVPYMSYRITGSGHIVRTYSISPEIGRFRIYVSNLGTDPLSAWVFASYMRIQ